MEFSSKHQYGRQTSPAADLAIERSIAVITPLSRSFQGESNTDVSAQKEAFAIDREEIAPQVALNFRRAVQLLLTLESRDIRGSTEAQLILLDTSRVVNHRLHPLGRPFLRNWETPFSGHASVAELPDAYEAFCGKFASEWAFGFRAPIEFSAWMEWSSNARGHFWYDGCGRISRGVSVTALARNGLVYPTFESRDEYFSLINESLDQWTRSYRSRVSACNG